MNQASTGGTCHAGEWAADFGFISLLGFMGTKKVPGTIMGAFYRGIAAAGSRQANQADQCRNCRKWALVI